MLIFSGLVITRINDSHDSHIDFFKTGGKLFASGS